MKGNVLNLLLKIYDNMSLDELDEIGVCFTLGVDDKKEYFHSGFNCQSIENCKELDSDNRIDSRAMEILKHSLSELNRSRDKHISYDWSPEDMAHYAYEMSAAMESEKALRDNRSTD